MKIKTTYTIELAVEEYDTQANAAKFYALHKNKQGFLALKRGIEQDFTANDVQAVVKKITVECKFGKVEWSEQ